MPAVWPGTEFTEPATPFDLRQVLRTFSQNSSVNPASNPSLPWRVFGPSDVLAIGEILVRNTITKQLVALSPGSRERDIEFNWPYWIQVA